MTLGFSGRFSWMPKVFRRWTTKVGFNKSSSLLKRRKALEMKQASWSTGFSPVFLAGANTNIHLDYIYISLDIQGHLLSKIFGYIVRIRNPPTGYLQLNYCACFTGRWSQSFIRTRFQVFARASSETSDVIFVYKSIYPLETNISRAIDGWKMKCPFKMVPFNGTC